MQTRQLIALIKDKTLKNQLSSKAKQKICDTMFGTKKDEHIGDSDLPIQIQEALAIYCKLHQKDFSKFKLSDVAGSITEKQMLRLRRIGKTYVKVLKKYMTERGYVLRKK